MFFASVQSRSASLSPMGGSQQPQQLPKLPRAQPKTAKVNHHSFSFPFLFSDRDEIHLASFILMQFSYNLSPFLQDQNMIYIEDICCDNCPCNRKKFNIDVWSNCEARGIDGFFVFYLDYFFFKFHSVTNQSICMSVRPTHQYELERISQSFLVFFWHVISPDPFFTSHC